MTGINKQKFLAELSKLLTFMYEEDRQKALSLYEEMFDSCGEEQQLIQHLVSPTRQAVVLARTYNSKERMLSVESRSREGELYEDEGQDTPAFVSAIEEIKEKAGGIFAARTPVHASQISLFAEESIPEAAPAVSTVQPDSVSAPEAAPAVEAESAAPSKEAELPVLLPEEEAAYEEDFTQSAVDSSPAYEYEAEPVRPHFADDDERLLNLAPSQREKAADPGRERVRVVPMLILYIFLAVPLSIFVVSLLLFPTMLCLFMSLLCAAVGISVLGSAFGSFAIFADILVVLGAGLVLMALGLLFLWLFVWFIGSVIAGFINGVIKLGDAFSSKEVPAK